MKKVILVLALLISASYVQAATEAAEQRVELKDGTVLVIKPNGEMKHFDAEGNRLRMRDGKVMMTADGQKYMMKNDTLWKAIIEKGTLRSFP